MKMQYAVLRGMNTKFGIFRAGRVRVSLPSAESVAARYTLRSSIFRRIHSSSRAQRPLGTFVRRFPDQLAGRPPLGRRCPLPPLVPVRIHAHGHQLVLPWQLPVPVAWPERRVHVIRLPISATGLGHPFTLFGVRFGRQRFVHRHAEADPSAGNNPHQAAPPTDVHLRPCVLPRMPPTLTHASSSFSHSRPRDLKPGGFQRRERPSQRATCLHDRGPWRNERQPHGCKAVSYAGTCSGATAAIPFAGHGAAHPPHVEYLPRPQSVRPAPYPSCRV